jgi:hypothetical protein
VNKKKQKTLSVWMPLHRKRRSRDSRVPCQKSFLLLFFKKEDASFLPPAFCSRSDLTAPPPLLYGRTQGNAKGKQQK